MDYKLKVTAKMMRVWSAEPNNRSRGRMCLHAESDYEHFESECLRLMKQESHYGRYTCTVEIPRVLHEDDIRAYCVEFVDRAQERGFYAHADAAPTWLLRVDWSPEE